MEKIIFSYTANNKETLLEIICSNNPQNYNLTINKYQYDEVSENIGKWEEHGYTLENDKWVIFSNENKTDEQIDKYIEWSCKINCSEDHYTNENGCVIIKYSVKNLIFSKETKSDENTIFINKLINGKQLIIPLEYGNEFDEYISIIDKKKRKNKEYHEMIKKILDKKKNK